MALQLTNITKIIAEKQVLYPINYTFEEHETTVIVGPSGCGKSTLFRIIMGIIEPTTGSISFGDQVLTNENANRIRHQIGYVIQDGGLFPHLNAYDNIALLARYLKLNEKIIKKKMEQLVDVMQLKANVLQLFPWELSGGQKQRVGIIRALFLDPPYIFLDEPLGALDPLVKEDLQHKLKQIFDTLKKTVILVTHNMHEAQFFADKMIIMKEGKVVQSGTYDELKKTPVNSFVEQFLNVNYI
ncbi:Glycine betaine/carnitine/choline transport ATP-binding protein OpuCA [Candidatus Rubidus massiliensis]|nr:Glycine betaine/carnitine/choline transport ATP-binding protein OpuCA [Candidatus Rubidus massiliensis]